MYYVINIVENAKNSISTRTTSWIPTRLGSKWGTRPSLLAVTESHHAAGANSLSSVLFLLDLSAAFNTVNHQILLSTLEGMGVSGSALSLFASYLTGRSYQVTLRIGLCQPHRLTTGVLQVSVLGPLLFSFYTTSLSDSVVIRSHDLSYHCYAKG